MLLIKLALGSQVCWSGIYFNSSVNLLPCFLVNEIILCFVLLGVGKVFYWLPAFFALLSAHHIDVFQNTDLYSTTNFYLIT